MLHVQRLVAVVSSRAFSFVRQYCRSSVVAATATTTSSSLLRTIFLAMKQPQRMSWTTLFLSASRTIITTTTTKPVLAWNTHLPTHSTYGGSGSRWTSLSTRRFVFSDVKGEQHQEEDSTTAAAAEEEEEAAALAYSTSYHAPVMWKECIEALLVSSSSSDDETQEENPQEPRQPRYFVDGTLGGGGHSEALLRQCQPSDVVFGCDVDPDALSTASQRLAEYMQGDPTKPLFCPVASNFCQLETVLPTIQHPVTKELVLPQSSSVMDGILLDLGVSSFQIDTAERGFAFMKDGPLDMRMSGNGSSSSLNASNLCNELDANELSRIFKIYGDEPRSKAVAQAIVKHRPLHTTGDLVAAVSSVVPQFAKRGRRQGRTATLARVFQALRIVVNQEDAVLEQALTEMAPNLLRPGGRLVVLSYHSMEDRMTKRVLRDGTVQKVRAVERDLYGNPVAPGPFAPAGKAQKATDAEVAANPRARSATLRVGIRQ